MGNGWNEFISSQGVKTRFGVTLVANVLKIGFGFLAGIIIARGFGPGRYGDFCFLLGSFVSINALIDMGTSSAFYTFLSKRRRGSKFYIYYFSWLAIQFIAVLLLVVFIFPESWRQGIWLGHERLIIVQAFLASFMITKLWTAVTQTGESIRATVTVQLYNVVVTGLYLCVVFLVATFGRLSISNLFIINTVLYLAFALFLGRRLKKDLITDEATDVKTFLSEFRGYCTPLLICGAVGCAYQFVDLWLLQNFGGAVQQGFYSVGFRFKSICLIATTSMLQVFWKEIAEANQRNDKEKLRRLYMTTSKGLCFVGALGSCFLIPFSRDLLKVLLGADFVKGWFALSIMFLYPVHQSLGQINGTYLYATGRTVLYAKLGIIMMACGIPVTYFLLASPSAVIPGLGLGAIGLALKVVGLQMITVNILGFFVCKKSGWRYSILYQFISIGLLLSIAFGVKGLLEWVLHLFHTSVSPIPLMALCVPMYMAVVLFTIVLFPKICGLKRAHIKEAIVFLKKMRMP